MRVPPAGITEVTRMGKFKARYVVIPLVLLAVAGGGFALAKSQQNKDIVKVAPASEAAGEVYGFDGEKDSFYGKLQKGSVANVKVNMELKIDSVNVKKGDTVKKGDVLISYDTHSLSDAVDDAELEVKSITNEIQILDNEIDIICKLQPSENAPQPAQDDEEENADSESDSDKNATPDMPKTKYPAVLTAASKPIAGTGTADDPFMFAAGTYTVVSKELLSSFAEQPAKSAVFYVFSEEDMQLFARGVDGSKVDPDAVQDFAVSDGVSVTPDGMISFSGSSPEFASFAMAAAAMPEGEVPDYSHYGEFELPENFEIPDDTTPTEEDTDAATYELSLNDHYMYSLQQLKDMLKEKQNQKAQLELDKRQAELNVKKAQYLAQTGGETAAIDGTVTFVAKDINHLAESGAYITITNDSGMSVSAAVGEFSLGKVEVGMTATVSNFETGAETTGVVTELSDTPAESGSAEDMSAGGMESMYKFTVALDNDMDINEDSEVQIVLDREKEAALMLPNTLIRSESGRYYVMAESEEGLLNKRYVTVGEMDYSSVEILDGITGDDYIAFPYGKAKVGAKVKETTFEDMYYNYGLFG